MRLHWMFGPTLALFGFGGRLKEALLLFGLVLAHEIVHGVVAFVYGMRPKEIELLPVGGVIRFHDVLEHRPMAEIIVSLAGPVFNLAMAGCALLFVWCFPDLSSRAASFIKVNVVLACFNMLPALPLDGGRIVRALLTMRIGYGKATRTIAAVSRLIALLLVVGGLLGSLYGVTATVLTFLGFVVRRHARHELLGMPFVLLSYLAGSHPVSSAGGVTRVVSLAARTETTLDMLLPWLVPGKYHLFCVHDEEKRQAQIVTEQCFRHALFTSGLNTPMSALAAETAADADGHN